VPAARQDLTRALHEVAFRQSGYFTAAQARETGYSYQAQKYHVDAGNWVRVDRGIFRLPGWPAARDDAYIRWGLWAGGRAVISHATALAAFDLSDVDPARVHVTVPPGFRGSDPAVDLHRAILATADVEDRGAWRITTPLRTLVDVAAEGVTQEIVDDAVAAALERGLVTKRRLRDAADLKGDRAGLRIERALAALTERP
jgi:predicted transcriptional regulator of viral defense system